MSLYLNITLLLMIWIRQVAENDPAEWAYLKYSCDNKTECKYVYNGAIINDCEAGYVADYMLIYYSCLPG